jgi:hypothetical protein
MKKMFPAFPIQPHRRGSERLTQSQIEERKRSVQRGFEALQDELERLERSMSAEDWERFNRPI